MQYVTCHDITGASLLERSETSSTQLLPPSRRPGGGKDRNLGFCRCTIALRSSFGKSNCVESRDGPRFAHYNSSTFSIIHSFLYFLWEFFYFHFKCSMVSSRRRVLSLNNAIDLFSIRVCECVCVCVCVVYGVWRSA
ncbi:hypothetical protein CLIB1423_17S01904 [[Candida] railenensis]|uniref:Uncharacterized protein n=1 Tax=[Candida] railenensis TaxID=45579 RepID=A0A9P0QU39_9ASCO|nr:hypothetical protein CLIB1423_17S01904 [[Candida] railenensis]